MTKKELVRIIREVVKREIKTVLSEGYGKQPVAKKSTKKLSKNPLINEALNATNEFETMGTFSQKDAVGGLRSKFMELQGGEENINMTPPEMQHKVEAGSNLDKALTRDYSELVKRFKK